ncbi:hypothetical protein [Marinobacterium arenosum]|uniref:hypothetical protein n=1 Tax=Marinobacterium arenosum TaxID=2862496 RepID=UPI001C94471A|nr:hypothetical protein [Marinobacterium arenosum]MBY4675805.1 hypothetical protein [Marinobacterium arenosum]
MFEAHTFSFQDAGLDGSAVPVETSVPVGDAELPDAIQLIHRDYRCPLYVWFAEGKRKDRQRQPQPVWFIYVEYRRGDGSRASRVLERPRTGPLPAALWHELATLPLADISPAQCRANPVRRAQG